MRKAKVVLKETGFNDEGFSYSSSDRGDTGKCFTMAVGYATSLAKQNGVSITKLKEIITEIYKETEEVE